MKVNVLHIVLLFFITLDASSQEGLYEFETEFPITMSMTPLIDKSSSGSDETLITMLSVSDDEYNFMVLSHSINDFSYSIAARLEDGLPIYGSMSFFRNVSFLDLNWNYEHEKFNFSVTISNIFNFRNSIIESEPYLERQSLVAEEVYFNQEATSMVQASIKYRF